jgi:hypothetical protein
MTVGTALASAAFSVFALMSAGTLLFGEEQIGTVFGVAGLFMSVFEVSRQRDGGSAAAAVGGGPDAREPFRFPAEQGLAGGLFGGVIAGLVITVVYYVSLQQYVAWMVAHNLAVPTFWELLSPILIASALIGAVVGILSLGLAELFGYLARPITVLLINRLTGALLGGLLAGLITGPLGTLYFGRIQWPVLHPAQMLAGALPAAGLLVFAILYFGKAQFNSAVWTGLLVAMLATVMVGALAAVVLSALESEIAAMLMHYIVQGDRGDLLMGGLFYGGFVGTLLGAVVGLTLVLAPAIQTLPALRGTPTASL